jgi:polysaccharide biosynthesis protein PslA
MSLVGPRPHALGASAEGALYWEAVPTYWQRHSVMPGLTGLAQIRGYRGPTEKRSEIANRVASDLEYIQTWSLRLDIKILVRTLRVLIHHNAF